MEIFRGICFVQSCRIKDIIWSGGGFIFVYNVVTKLETYN